MMSGSTDRCTIGIEEEYQIVEAETGELRSRAGNVLPRARAEAGDEVQPELYQSQIEIASQVCSTLDDVRGEVVRLRRAVIEAAARDGGRIVAAGTHPFSEWRDQQTTPKDRYRQSVLKYQQITRELVIFGCHVHVGMPDREAALQVFNRARLWLAPILALTANSPYWLGSDTGYASYRTQLWSRLPISGPPAAFASLAEYESVAAALVTTESIPDETRIYWDLRLPVKQNTIEFRMTDVCLTADEAVMTAGLVRALACMALDSAERDEPFTPVRQELLRVAHWRAARYGMERDLIDLHHMRPVAAGELVDQLLEHVRPVLEERGEWGEVTATVDRIRTDGTAARRQREAYRRSETLQGVVDYLADETERGVTAAAG